MALITTSDLKGPGIHTIYLPFGPGYSVGPTHADVDVAERLGRKSRLPKHWWPRPIKESAYGVTLRDKDIKRLKRFAPDAVYFQKLVFGEAMRLAQRALNPVEAGVAMRELYQYLAAQLQGAGEMDAIRYGLQLTDALIRDVPHGLAADLVRAQLFAVLSPLSPRFVRAYDALAHFSLFETATGDVAGVIAGYEKRPSAIGALHAPVLQTRLHHARILWSEAWGRQRCALRWALFEGDKHIAALNAATKVFAPGYNFNLGRAIRAALYTQPSVSVDIVLSDAAWAEVQDIDTICKKLGGERIGPLGNDLMDVGYKSRPGSRRKQFYQALVAAHTTDDTQAMLHFLKSAQGQVFARGAAKLRPALTADGDMILNHAKVRAASEARAREPSLHAAG